MASSLERLLDNRSRRSSSRVQTSSMVGVATSDPGEGWLGEAASLGVFVSGDPPFEAWTALGAGGVWTATNLPSSARADCAWVPSARDRSIHATWASFSMLARQPATSARL
jgi:hypothetical protein